MTFRVSPNASIADRAVGFSRTRKSFTDRSAHLAENLRCVRDTKKGRPIIAVRECGVRQLVVEKPLDEHGNRHETRENVAIEPRWR